MKANESQAMYIPAELAKQDRKQFVKNLGELLTQTREGIAGAELDDEDYVTVKYKNGFERRICVAMDSYIAIIRDVMRGL